MYLHTGPTNEEMVYRGEQGGGVGAWQVHDEAQESSLT